MNYEVILLQSMMVETMNVNGVIRVGTIKKQQKQIIDEHVHRK